MKPAAALVLRGSALIFGLASATDFYVSPDGSDDNAGDSVEQPFQTLIRAQEAVRELATEAISEDISIYLASGIYTLFEPLRFNGANSGKNGYMVNWIGDNTTLSGRLRVMYWKEESDSIYSASVPEGMELQNLYVGDWAANFARQKLDNQTYFTYTANGIT